MTRNRKSRYRLFALVLAAILVFAAFPASVAASASYDDVSETQWYHDAVEYVTAENLFEGSGNRIFSPNSTMTRAMFAQVLYNRSEGTAVSDEARFSDVKPSAWYAGAAGWAGKLNIVLGVREYPASDIVEFQPNRPITRQEMALMLYRYAISTEEKMPQETNEADRYADWGDVSGWAQEAMRWAVDTGVLQGANGWLNPQQYAKRSEVAQLFMRYHSKFHKTDAVKTVMPAQMSETARRYGLRMGNYPRINGSTSTLEIVQRLYGTMHDGDYNWYDYPAEPVKTVPAYEKLIDGELDLIFVPDASADILRLAKEKGVELEFKKVALEALVFITPYENTAENITEEQIRSIYLNYGIKSWAELNGPNRELVPLCRNADSGSQSQLDNLILKGETMHPDIEKNFVVMNMDSMLNMTAYYHHGGMDSGPTDSYALGYTLYQYFLFSKQFMGKDTLKMLSYNGVEPTAETIQNGSYPLNVSYYAVTRKNLPGDHSARKILSFLDAEEGKTMIDEIFGFAEIPEPEPEPPYISPSAAPDLMPGN